jgi:hypothetical protein
MPDLNDLSNEINSNAAAHGFWPDERLNLALDWFVDQARLNTADPAKIEKFEKMLRP